MRVVQEFEFDEFDWDPAKRKRTFVERDLDFADAARALLEPHLETPSDRGEPRTKAIACAAGRVIVVIFTIRGSVCRIISAWPADKNEQRKFRQIFGG